MTHYTMQWTQPYTCWPKPVPVATITEPTITDLTQARELLARIMAK